MWNVTLLWPISCSLCQNPAPGSLPSGGVTCWDLVPRLYQLTPELFIFLSHNAKESHCLCTCCSHHLQLYRFPQAQSGCRHRSLLVKKKMKGPVLNSSPTAVRSIKLKSGIYLYITQCISRQLLRLTFRKHKVRVLDFWKWHFQLL